MSDLVRRVRQQIKNKVQGDQSRQLLVEAANALEASHLLLVSMQEWWDLYNVGKLSGDEFACLVATLLQLRTTSAQSAAGESK